MSNGATSLAEGSYKFKTDVGLVLGNEREVRTHVLRTTLDDLSVWKSRNVGVSLAPYEDRATTGRKTAALIDNEMWVYGINATMEQDIVAAVKIASKYFRVDPAVFLSDIYVKNLNAERENEMEGQALIRANKDLYGGVSGALTAAAKYLGVSGRLQLYVFSHNKNPKIPQQSLADALIGGGAASVVTDEHRPKVEVGSNTGQQSIRQRTNFHLATLNV